MVVLERLSRFLHHEGTNFEVHRHPAAFTARSVARSEHLPLHCVAKVVVVHTADGYRMLVLPASRRVHMGDLRDALAEPGVRLATEEELARVFPECEVGAMPPFGNLWGMPVWVDESLKDYDEIVFSAGNHRQSVHMRYDDFDCLVNPEYASFSREDDG